MTRDPAGRRPNEDWKWHSARRAMGVDAIPENQGQVAPAAEDSDRNQKRRTEGASSSSGTWQQAPVQGDASPKDDDAMSVAESVATSAAGGSVAGRRRQKRGERAKDKNAELGRMVTDDDEVVEAARLIQIALNLSKKETRELYRNSSGELKVMFGKLVRHHSTAVDENEPLEMAHAVIWEAEEVVRNGQKGTLLRAMCKTVAQKFVPHQDDGTAATAEAQREAVEEIASGLIQQVERYATDRTLRREVIDAITHTQPATSKRAKALHDQFQIFGGTGATQAGREARRDALQQALRDGRAALQDPVSPSATAAEVRCAPVEVDTKSPKSLSCVNCGRGVGGLGRDESSQDRRLVAHGGPCSHCGATCCANCFGDRGAVGLAPSEVQPNDDVRFDGDPTVVVPKLGWACVSCAPRPSLVTGELFNWFETDKKCGHPKCTNVLTAGVHHGWLHSWKGNFRETDQWKYPTYAGRCNGCMKVFWRVLPGPREGGGLEGGSGP